MTELMDRVGKVDGIGRLDRIVLRRKSRTERLAEEVGSLPPVARIALVAFGAAVVVGLAFLARRRLFAAAAVVAEAVEEVADTVEDTAEDLAGAARERAEGTAGSD